MQDYVLQHPNEKSTVIMLDVGDFTKALNQVIEDYAPDRILIEPSGVGKLSDVAKAVSGVPGAVIGSKITVVDAGKCRMYVRNFGEFFNDQVCNADIIVLSRTDSTSDGKVVAASALLTQLNPNAAVISPPRVASISAVRVRRYRK